MTTPAKLPLWGTLTPAGYILEPSTSKKQLGFGFVGADPERPPLQDFNWWMNNVYQWVNHLSTDIALRGEDTILNAQASFVDLTGVLVNPLVYRAFELTGVVFIDATTDLTEMVTLSATYNAVSATWTWSQTFKAGAAPCQCQFQVTPAGQVQYTSGTYAGYSDGKITWQLTALPL